MSIISFHELHGLISSGVVVGGDLKNVNAASIDVRLGGEVLVERYNHHADGPVNPVLRLGDRTAMDTVKRELGADGYVLEPGEFILAHTLEKFNLPLNISAEFRLKSSAARMGLSHALAVWCDPGWTGSTLTLELHNISRFHSIQVHPGDKIGQMVFHKHEPVPVRASYARRGAYNNDAGASATKPERS